MKRVLPVLLALVMLLALTAPARAADSDFEIDDAGVLKKYTGPAGK